MNAKPAVTFEFIDIQWLWLWSFEVAYATSFEPNHYNDIQHLKEY